MWYILENIFYCGPYINVTSNSSSPVLLLSKNCPTAPAKLQGKFPLLLRTVLVQLFVKPSGLLLLKLYKKLSSFPPRRNIPQSYSHAASFRLKFILSIALVDILSLLWYVIIAVRILNHYIFIGCFLCIIFQNVIHYLLLQSYRINHLYQYWHFLNPI